MLFGVKFQWNRFFRVRTKGLPPTNSLVISYTDFSNRVSSSQTTTTPVSIVVVMILVMEFEEREGVSLVGQTSPGRERTAEVVSSFRASARYICDYS